MNMRQKRLIQKVIIQRFKPLRLKLKPQPIIPFFSLSLLRGMSFKQGANVISERRRENIEDEALVSPY